MPMIDPQKDPICVPPYYSHALCDISDPNQVNDSLVTHAITAFESLNHHRHNQSSTVQFSCLVNNAAIVDPTSIAPADDIRTWKKVIDTNLTGAFLLSNLLIPHLSLAPSPSIVNISSTRAHQSEPHHTDVGWLAYASSKAGLLGLTQALSQSKACTNSSTPIRVNTISPGWIDTSGTSSSTSGDVRRKDHAWHAVGRVGTPDDVAALCLFLADASKSGFISGQEFVVDGGVSKKMVYPASDDDKL